MARGRPALIDPNYHTPYALHATAGVQHALSANWIIGADFTRETGMHGYRSYNYPAAYVFRSDNRSSYNGFSVRLQGNVARRVHLTGHTTRWPKRRHGAACSANFSIT